MSDKVTILDLSGILTIAGTLFISAWNIFMEDPINTSIVTITGMGGAIYVFYKVRNERKKSKLLDHEMKQKGIN